VRSRGGEPEDARRITERPAPRRSFRGGYGDFEIDAKLKAPFEAGNLMGKLG
jgi:hypothetical protein